MRTIDKRIYTYVYLCLACAVAVLLLSPGCGSANGAARKAVEAEDGRGGIGDGGINSGLQSLFDYSQNTVADQTTVIQTYSVTVNSRAYTVNELEDGDPFISTYQLENGDIVITNQPPAAIAAGAITVATPQTQTWQSPDGPRTVETGKIVCSFYETVTQQQISDFIAEHNLQVVFSSFEGPDPGQSGNGIAVFAFTYDQTEFTSLESALAGYAADPLIEFVLPNVLDHFTADYAQGIPTDAYYRLSDMRHLNIYDVDDSNNGIDIGPPNGSALSRVAIAVMDDGVERSHPDFQIPGDYYHRKISRVGMNCYGNGTSLVGNNAGAPDLWDPVMQRWVSHGTSVAGVVCATAQTTSLSAAGVAGLAPDCGVFPIRLRWDWYDGVETFSTLSAIEAFTALRKKVGLGTYYEDIRVVNMSFGSPNFQGQADFVERLIARDIKRNDRLYVGSAGNEAAQRLRYPAAYDMVLGVSGFWTTSTGQYWYATLLNGSGSNYWNDSNLSSSAPWQRKYPISGIYGITTSSRTVNSNQSYSTTTFCFSMQDDPYYASFSGTSFAAPQISALGALLYDKKYRNGTITDYQAVSRRIVSTRITSMENQGGSYLAGRANFVTALSGF